jgi:hypothetical protein
MRRRKFAGLGSAAAWPVVLCVSFVLSDSGAAQLKEITGRLLVYVGARPCSAGVRLD